MKELASPKLRRDACLVHGLAVVSGIISCVLIRYQVDHGIAEGGAVAVAATLVFWFWSFWIVGGSLRDSKREGSDLLLLLGMAFDVPLLFFLVLA